MVRLILGLISIALLVGCRGASPVSGASPEAAMAFVLKSPDFANGATIPRQFTCDGADRSPTLQWSDLPGGTRSLALIVEDPDAPRGTFVHWVLYNLPAEPPEITAGTPRQTELPNGARQGRNDFRRVGYGGPCPPQGSTHRYFFRLYALDAPVGLTPGATASELRSAMQGHVIGQAELMGTYGR